MASDQDLPTIGDSRKLWMRRLRIHCGNLHCRHQSELTFDALGMADEMLFVDIPLSRRFRCTRFGSHEVEVSPIWDDVPGGHIKLPMGGLSKGVGAVRGVAKSFISFLTGSEMTIEDPAI